MNGAINPKRFDYGPVLYPYVMALELRGFTVEDANEDGITVALPGGGESIIAVDPQAVRAWLLRHAN